MELNEGYEVSSPQIQNMLRQVCTISERSPSTDTAEVQIEFGAKVATLPPAEQMLALGAITKGAMVAEVMATSIETIYPNIAGELRDALNPPSNVETASETGNKETIIQHNTESFKTSMGKVFYAQAHT